MGFENAGMKCKGHVEWDKFAQQSYEAIYGDREGYKDEFCGWDIRGVRAADLPRVDVWTFGAPCQDFSIAGQRKGMDGDRSSLIREIFRLIEESEHRPEWLIYENVKGMLSSNRGWDFFGILFEMDKLGYDIEWQIFNSKDWGVPQNRERVYTIGHLRERGGRKILPIKGQSGQADSEIVGKLALPGKDQWNRVYSPDGLAPTLVSMQGGRQEPKIKVIGTLDTERHSDMNVHSVSGISPTLTARGYKGPVMVGYSRQEPKIKVVGDFPGYEKDGRVLSDEGLCSTLSARDFKGPVMVAEPIDQSLDYEIEGENFNQRGVVHGTESVSRTLISSSHSGNEPKVAIPVSSPDYQTKNQNGRRFKEDGDPMFTLTAQDRHGVMIKEATKAGYAIAEPGDSVNLEQPNSETRRGRVGKGIANTLTTGCQQGVVEAAIEPNVKMRETEDGFHLCRNDEKKSSIQGTHVTYQDGVSHCLTSAHKPMTIEPKIIDDQGRVKDKYKQHDIVPCLRAQTHGNPPKVIDALYNNRPPRVYEDAAPTLRSDRHGLLTIEQRYVDGMSDEYSFAKKKAQAMLNEKGELPERFNPYNLQKIDEIAPTLTANCDRSASSSTVLMKQPNFRIRKLTPLECWRLQGFPDWAHERAKTAGVSDSQRYKQAGNSVTVNVTEAIGRAIVGLEVK